MPLDGNLIVTRLDPIAAALHLYILREDNWEGAQVSDNRWLLAYSQTQQQNFYRIFCVRNHYIQAHLRGNEILLRVFFATYTTLSDEMAHVVHVNNRKWRKNFCDLAKSNDREYSNQKGNSHLVFQDLPFHSIPQSHNRWIVGYWIWQSKRLRKT